MALEMIDILETYEALVLRVQTTYGHEREEAFSALIRQFGFAAQSWAFQTLGDIHAAQDVSQEAFITAYEKLSDLRDPAAFPTWLRMIVRTHCNRNLRQSHDMFPLSEVEPALEDPAQTAEEHIIHDKLHTAVDALPAHERVVTELFYLKGYSQQEIAEQLQVPLTTVKKRLQYAREHLRETMPPLNMLMLCVA